MIRTIDVILFGGRNGFVLRTDLVKQALRELDREALEDAERSRWSVIGWDGTTDPPIGERHRWIHEVDAIGRATKEAIENGKCVYFLMKDGKLQHYQPYRAYDRGRIDIEKDDENHPNHWKNAGRDHIEIEVERVVDQQVLELALERALELHEQNNIPVGITSVQLKR